MKGFTLVELLVVMAIMALVLAVAVPHWRPVPPSVRLRATADELASALRQTRHLAIRRQRPESFTLDLEQRLYRSGEIAASHQLPTDLDLTLDTVAAAAASETLGAIRFFPDGGSTGGRIVLSHASDSRQVTVDWLTGRIAVR